MRRYHSSRARGAWAASAVILLALPALGMGSSSPAIPAPPFNGYGLGNFTGPYHVARTILTNENVTIGGCANSTAPSFPYFNPVTGRSVSVNYAQVGSCPGQNYSVINSATGAGAYFLVNSSVGRISVLLKMTVRVETFWNYTPGTCTPLTNTSVGGCDLETFVYSWADAGLANSTLAGLAYGTAKNPTIVDLKQSATCSGGTCSSWSTVKRNGATTVTWYYTFSFTYDMSPSGRYFVWAGAEGGDYPILYWHGTNLTGASIVESSKLIWSVNSILIT